MRNSIAGLLKTDSDDPLLPRPSNGSSPKNQAQQMWYLLHSTLGVFIDFEFILTALVRDIACMVLGKFSL
jgi:hypothetical protein